MWGSGFSTSKLKPQLKMASQRFQISSNKKSAVLKQQKREIAQLIAATPPKTEEAIIRTESLIREDNTIEAYEILKLSCELLVERLKLISSQKTCPADLVSTIQTLIWASNRVDISEMNEIRKQFKTKYGKQFYEDAMNNADNVLNERVFVKLSVQPPSGRLVQAYLEKIAEEFEVDWESEASKLARGNDDRQMPPPAPSGYSVPMAQGSGLAGGFQQDGIPYAQDVRYDDGCSVNGGGCGAHVPSAPGAYSVPGPPARDPKPPKGPGGGGVVGGGVPPPIIDADIYIPPSAPTNAPGGGTPRGGGGGDDDDDDDLNDLKAKFAQLKK